MAHVMYHHTSSEEFLESFQGKIDLLYLDTGDVRCREREREREREKHTHAHARTHTHTHTHIHTHTHTQTSPIEATALLHQREAEIILRRDLMPPGGTSLKIECVLY